MDKNSKDESVEIYYCDNYEKHEVRTVFGCDNCPICEKKGKRIDGDHSKPGVQRSEPQDDS